MEEIELKTKDNVTIRANFYSTNHNHILVICPGWFMTKDSKAFTDLATDFSKDYDVITMDFRGHGRSGGFYTFTAKEEQDIEVIVEFAKTIYSKISLLGFSLGGALVILHCAKNKQIHKCIAVSAPTEFLKIENRMYSPKAWYPTLFQKFEPRRWLSIRAGNPFLRKTAPIDVVNKLKNPTLFIAGKNDPTVFEWHTKTLFKKAQCPKSYILFQNGNHAEDLYIEYREEFLKACNDWLKD